MSAKLTELRTMHLELQQRFQAVCQLAQPQTLVSHGSSENEMHEILSFTMTMTEFFDGMPETECRAIRVLRACEGMFV